MFRKLLLALVPLLALCPSIARAQDTTSQHNGCGFSLDYLISMGVDSPRHGATAAFVSPSAFPSYAIDTCGRFIIYYEDLQPGAPVAGFSASGGVGLVRRNTMCTVLTYVQSVFDFSAMSGKYIRLHVDTSWSNPGHTIPYLAGIGRWYNSTGICAAYYLRSTAVSGALVNGFVHQFIKSGTDPNPGDYHANLQMNFASIGRGLNDFTRDYMEAKPPSQIYYTDSGTVEPCSFDLHSNLLHLVSHSLGWFSWQDTGSLHGVSSTALPHTCYDTALCSIPDPRVTSNPFSGIAKLLPLGTLTSGIRFLLNGHHPPYNRFVYYGGTSPFPPFGPRYEFSHLVSYHYRDVNRITPGDTYNPVMGLPIMEGVMSREYTKAELLHFRDVIGLGLQSSFTSGHATILNNHLPWSSRMNSDAYNFTAGNRDFAETVAANYTINNDIGTTVVINLNADTSLHDDDNDALSVYPGSLVNFRGCGDGGNNHNRLALSNSDGTITYTPRPGFYGRCQFGFNLYDGSEKGAFVIYTIEVLPGSNVSVSAGDNMVVNGDFEEGAEVKLQGTDEAINNTYTNGFLKSDNSIFGGRFNTGTIISDGHPYDALSNYLYGTAIRNSYAECGTASSGRPFGHPANSFPWPTFWLSSSKKGIWSALTGPRFSDGFPDAKTTGSNNDRYQPLGADGILMNLADTMKQCKRYLLEFDAYRTYGAPPKYATDSFFYPATERVQFGFTRSELITDLTTTPMIVNYDVRIGSISRTGWEHFKIPFSYCSDTTSNVLFLDIAGALANNETIATTLLDNVSLKEVPLDLTVEIIDSPTVGCNSMLLAGPVTNGCPSMSYIWRDETGATVGTSRGLSVATMDTVRYTVEVSDGCSTAYDTIDVTPCRCAATRIFGTDSYTDLSGVVSSLSAGFYHATADLNITASSATFTDAIILFEPGVKIDVGNSSALIIDHSHLFTCPDTNMMWQGIRLASGSTSSATIEVRNDCLIEDAEFAIDAIGAKEPASGDLINVTNSTFNRNQVDISLNGYPYGSSATCPITIYNNLFTARHFNATTMSGYPLTWETTATLKAQFSPTDAKPAYEIVHYDKALCKNPAMFSYLGVRMYGVGVSAGASSYTSEVQIGMGAASDDYNLFDNHAYGVVSNNSNIKLFNNHFINISRRMEPDTSTTKPDDGGMAVSLTAGANTHYQAKVIPSLAGNLPNRFHDCFIGIYTENMETADINYNRITTGNTRGTTAAGAAYPSETYAGCGIMIVSNRNLVSTNATYNYVSNCNIGLHLDMTTPPAATMTAINNNHLLSENPDISSAYTTEQYMNQAIQAYGNGSLATPTSYASISDNMITADFNGILMNSLKTTRCSVVNNTIVLKDVSTPVTPIQTGIAVYSTIGATLFTNTVSASSVGEVDKLRGITAGYNSDLRICGNKVTNMSQGFRFEPGIAQVGTRFIKDTINGGHKGMWLGSEIGEQGLMYNYITLTPKLIPAPIKNIWNITAGGTFHTWVDGSTKSILSKLNVRNITTPGITELPTTNIADVPAYRYLYPSSIVVPEPTFGDADCHGVFYEVQYDPGPGRPHSGGPLVLALSILTDTLGYDTSYYRKQWMNQLAMYELGTIDPGLSDTFTAFATFMSNAAGTRFGWIVNVQLALDNEDTTTAETLLASIPSASGRTVIDPEVTLTDYSEADGIVDRYASYFGLYLKHLKGALSEQELEDLFALAQLCPSTDGAVVYQARTLHQLLTRKMVRYNDDSCAYGVFSTYRVTPQEKEPADAAKAYRLFPNPNNGSFIIARNEAISSPVMVSEAKPSTRIRVYNALGMQVYQVNNANFINGKLELNMGQRVPGLYLVCIEDGKDSPVCLRFILKS